jgi:hypothetical protein
MGERDLEVDVEVTAEMEAAGAEAIEGIVGDECAPSWSVATRLAAAEAYQAMYRLRPSSEDTSTN